MKINIIYVRVSSRQTPGGRKQEESLPKQTELLTGWSKELNLPGEWVIFQDDMSGSELNRPGLIAAMEAIEGNLVGNFMFFDESRVARNQGVAHAVWNLCFQHQVTLWNYAWRRRIDLNSIDDKMMLGMTGYVNEMFLRQMRRQCHDGAQRLLAKGCWTGRPPYGYRRGNEKKLEFVAEEIAIVKRILEEIPTRGLRNVAFRLESDRMLGKIGGPRGLNRPWAIHDLTRIIGNPVYTGAVVWNRTKKSKKVPRSEWKWTRGAHPAIISEERLQEIRALVRGRMRQVLSFKSRKSNELAGIAYCGHHDRMLVSVYDPKTLGHRFKCHNLGCPNTPLPVNIVREAISAHPSFQERPAPTALLAPPKSDGVEREREMVTIKAQIAQLEDRRRGMIVKFASGEWTKETLERESARIKAGTQDLRNSLAELESGRVVVRESPPVSQRGVVPIAEWLGVRMAQNGAGEHPRLRVYVYERRRVEVTEVAT